MKKQILTKEECIEAYNNLNFKLCELEEKETGVDVYCLYDEDLEKFKELINEHFENPPLRFEELQKGMWVWDNKEKRYSHIVSFAGICQIYFYDYTVDFEEERFFRMQVEE